MRVLRYVNIVPRASLVLILDDQGLNPQPLEVVTLTGQFGAIEGKVFYNNISLPISSWTDTAIVITWPDLPFALPEFAALQPMGYNIDFTLEVQAQGKSAARSVQTQPHVNDTYFQITAISSTGIFANDTNVNVGDFCVIRTDSGTLASADTDGDLVTTFPYTGRYQLWDGSSWGAMEATIQVG